MEIEIRHGWSPGLIGEVVRAHALYYSREWQFGPHFEAKVAREMADFIDRYAPDRDRVFRAVEGAAWLGGITIDGSDPALARDEAHLRWFIVGDDRRARGTGRRLMDAALSFLDAAGYGRCFLTTFAGLDAARHLYERAGFCLTQEAPSTTWGQRVLEQRFERVRAR